MADKPDGPAPAGPGPFRVAFVPGVTPGKWSRIWSQRMSDHPLQLIPIRDEDQLTVLRDGLAEMSFVRLPVERDGLHLIPLYREVPVVVVPNDHVVTVLDEVPVADLADEHLLQHPDSVPEWRDVASEVRNGTRVEPPVITLRQAIETVAAGTGIVIVPRSVARLHSRKDVSAVPVSGVAESEVGLAWLAEEATDPRVDTFIGIVRGRTERSSRGATAAAQEQPADKKAAAKSVAKPQKKRSPGGRPARGGARRRSGR